jgi:hypothetical protein
MAVGAVYCEPVSGRIPVIREKYREICSSFERYGVSFSIINGPFRAFGPFYFDSKQGV